MAWTERKFVSKEESDISKMGALMALAAIWKHGKRSDLLEHTQHMLEVITKMELKNNPNVLLRKLSLKVIQRLGLTFLRTKVAKWRYRRGNRSLAVNLESTDQGAAMEIQRQKVS